MTEKEKALDDENKELKLFCSAAAHDLKAPLHVIQMLTDMLKDGLGGEGEEELLELADMISRKSARLEAMVERLLEFWKMYDMTMYVQKISLEKIVKSVFEEQKSMETERNIELECDHLPEIMGDEILIEILMNNIMANAFKFTRKKENAVIKVTCTEDDNYIIISVRDNGAGFDMAYADKIFEVFQRLHTEEQYEGSGVGLALVDRIMKRHGGRAEAFGETGKGAEIRLYFLNRAD